MKKILLIVIAILLILWAVIFVVDYSRCNNFKEPIFVVASNTADDGGSGIYYGLGYKVNIEKTISAEYGPTLLKVEMYMFNKFIAGAIADTSNDNINTGNNDIEEGQYEFVATIIEASENYIIVEPEKDSRERKSSDKISMSITRPTSGVNDFYVVGNKVKITYNGNIMESYPAQINAIKIELSK